MFSSLVRGVRTTILGLYTHGRLHSHTARYTSTQTNILTHSACQPQLCALLALARPAAAAAATLAPCVNSLSSVIYSLPASNVRNPGAEHLSSLRARLMPSEAQAFTRSSRFVPSVPLRTQLHFETRDFRSTQEQVRFRGANLPVRACFYSVFIGCAKSSDTN